MKKHEIKERLRAGGIENAELEAALLLEAFEGEELSRAVSRRLEHYPLQYILGKWEFYRQSYEVSEDCLIPRSDTEILVETAIQMLPNGARFLDICTGSGCIAISTLAERRDTTAVAIDLFPDTLAIARRNAARNGVENRIALLQADALKAPPAELLRGGFDAILSNPPYILKSVMPHLQREVLFEPAVALCGGEDGLDFYRAILKEWHALLKPLGFILFEIGYDQREPICSIAEKHGFSCTVKRDFGGNDRVAVLTKST